MLLSAFAVAVLPLTWKDLFWVTGSWIFKRRAQSSVFF